MNGSTTALVFVGVLLVALGLFAAGNVALIGLGIVSLFGAGVFEAISARSR
jgi:hypothetical protein